MHRELRLDAVVVQARNNTGTPPLHALSSSARYALPSVLMTSFLVALELPSAPVQMTSHNAFSVKLLWTSDSPPVPSKFSRQRYKPARSRYVLQLALLAH